MTLGSILCLGLAALGCSSDPRAHALPDAPIAVDSAAPDAHAALCKQQNHALSFAGGQQVTIADSPSMRPQDLVLEVWARFAGFPGAFQTIVARPFGGSTGDSFAI